MNPEQRVPAGEKISYAMTTFGLNAVAGMVSAFVLYYYTDVALLSPAAVTWLLMAVRLFDGGIDPFIGHYMDSHRTRHGKYKGYLISWSLPFSLLSALIFLPSPIGAGAGRVLWYGLIYLAWSLCFSVLECANLPLLVVMTGDAKQRYAVNAAKTFGAILSTLVARYVALELVELLGGGVEAKGYALTAAVLAVLALLFLRIPARRIVERNSNPNTPPPLPEAAKTLLRDRQVRWMLLFFFAHQMASSVKGQASIYYMKYIVNRQGLTSVFLLIGTATSLAMQPAIAAAAKRVSIRLLILLGYLGGALSILLMGLAGPSVGLLFAGHILYGITVAFPANLLYVYVAQLADRQENSSSATLHSLLGLTSRLAVAISGSLIAAVLDFSNYMPNVAQTGGSQTGIKFVFVVLTSILYVAAAICSLLSFGGAGARHEVEVEDV